MFHKILVAVDNSPVSTKVFDEAVNLAKETNANLMLVHVLSPFDESYLTSSGAYSSSYYPTFNANNIEYYMGVWEELKEEGLKYLNMLGDEANKLGVPTEITQNLGDPGRTICELASNWNADLIIIGRRGRSGLNEFFLGSVSNYVLHHAPCSVLTVQGKNIVKAEEVEKLETTSF
ncbi:universal stress protein [Calothrix sp. UHCC 0171]|uniref:universal stress protein n=1 Tax=Calothrix sp. UHCC 0171 TaxID=3110245 RepID=UPI002B1F93B9|nr:universal stress protein [Calothrix sp. UHCC 0171]MEA5572199.1 universal stress protein [Calothrix sp. UHCC 0171]